MRRARTGTRTIGQSPLPTWLGSLGLLIVLAAMLAWPRGVAAATITEFTIPTSESQPLGIVTDSDGNLWFAGRASHKIGRITTSGIVTAYSLPGTPQPFYLTAAPDGAIWFTMYGGNAIGRITTAGAITWGDHHLSHPHPE